jgi:6-phosphogluconolactonase
MTCYQGFAGTYTGHDSRGVYSFRFENGILSDPKLFCEIASPKYLALENGRMAALADFEQGSGAVLLDAEGKVLSKLAYENKTSCYLTWHGGGLYSANYHDGTVSRLNIQDGKLELQKKVLIRTAPAATWCCSGRMRSWCRACFSMRSGSLTRS